MADAVSGATVDDDYETRHARAVVQGAVKDLLALLDPQEQDYHLDFLGILHRLHGVIATRILDEEVRRAQTPAR